MTWHWLDDYVVCLIPGTRIDDSAWDRYLEFLGERIADTRGILVRSPGAGPRGSQRARLRPVLGGQPPPCAVLTSSFLVRSIVNMFQWSDRGIRAFDLADVGTACLHLAMPAETQSRVRELLRGAPVLTTT